MASFEHGFCNKNVFIPKTMVAFVAQKMGGRGKKEEKNQRWDLSYRFEAKYLYNKFDDVNYDRLSGLGVSVCDSGS